MTLAIAHRGGSLGANTGIENTIAAFAHAVGLGYTHLETDVVCSRDGVPFVSHDDHLLRLTGRDLYLSQLDAVEVERLAIGGREPIPRLEELLTTFSQHWFSIDVKTDGALDPACAIIERTGSAGRVCLGSFDHQRVCAIRRRLPGTQTSASSREVALAMITPRIARQAPPYQWLSVPTAKFILPITTRRFIDAAHATGTGVLVWTIDDPTQMRDLLALGVDGIFTDRTDVLRDEFMARGIWQEPSP